MYEHGGKPAKRANFEMLGADILEPSAFCGIEFPSRAFSRVFGAHKSSVLLIPLHVAVYAWLQNHQIQRLRPYLLFSGVFIRTEPC